MARAALKTLDDTFFCKSRRLEVSLDKCLTDYMNAEVFDRKHRACYRCPEGRKNRETYAQGMRAEQTTGQ